MSKLVTFFLFMFVGMSILSSVMEGGGGMNSTILTDNCTSTDTTITVQNTNGFLDADYLIIEEETILYSGKTDTTFTGLSRGQDGTDAESHGLNEPVYTLDTSTLNHALGYNIAATTDTMGVWAVVTIPYNFLTKTIPKLVVLNWSFMTGDLQIIGFFWFAFGGGFIITLAILVVGGRRV